jgi:GPH family glycoside/pentoside/hexuronide:cation symporter
MSMPALSPAPSFAADPHPLPLVAKLVYGVGDMPITVLMGLSGLFILFFYNSVMGLPAALVGIGVAASLVLDAVLDPYIGHVSDRTCHQLGRRHAFMLPGALLTGPFFFLLFSPPRSLGHTGLFIWLVVFSIGVRVASAVYRIPYLSLGAEMSRDYDDRTSTMAIRSLFGLIGTLAATGLSFLLFFPGDADRLHYAGYPHLGLAFGAVMTLTGLVTCFGTLDYRTSGAGQKSTAPRFFSAFGISMRNVAFRSIWISTTVFFLAMVLNFSVAILYFTWYARINGSASLSLIQSCLYLGALAGVLLWMTLARRTEKRTLYIMATVATATLLLGAALLIGPGRPLGVGHPLPLIIGHVVAGIFASAVWVVPAAMIADVTDTDELVTGLRREGIYFGIMNFGEKIAAGGALFLAGQLLSLLGKLVPVPATGRAIALAGAAAAAGPPAATPYLGLLFGGVPALLLLVSLIFILPYRLDRRAVHAIQRQLADRKSELPAA